MRCKSCVPCAVLLACFVPAAWSVAQETKVVVQASSPAELLSPQQVGDSFGSRNAGGTPALQAIVAGGTPAPQDDKLNGLDQFVEEAMKEWKVPGLAVAVVHDGKIVHSKGYGFRDLDKQLPVTPDTLFAIGSISKSFTVTDLGLLVDEGKLDWDAPVRTYVSDFQLHDRFATEHMTARDLVTHRSGLPRHDFLWYADPSRSRKELYARLRFLEPSKEFRSTWQYQN